jgi:ribokinase
VPVILDAGGMGGPLPPELVQRLAVLSPNQTELEELTGEPGRKGT